MKKEITLEDSDFGKVYSGKYVFETISWGTSNQITSDCTTIEPASKKSSVDLQKLQARMLDATLIERPNSVTLDKLQSKDGIPVAMGELLMQLADAVNGYSSEEQEKLKKLKQRFGLESETRT